MNEPIWRAAALKDLDDIVSYIFLRNPDAAAELDRAIRARARLAARFPDAARSGRVPGTREAVVKKNIVLVYRATGRLGSTNNDVTILRVLHSRQRYPG